MAPSSFLVLLCFLLLPFTVATPLFETVAQLAWKLQCALDPDFDLGKNNTVQHNETEHVGWYDPRVQGGRFIDYTTKKHGEPLNIIVSNLSDPFILSEAGFRHYVKSLGYSEECLGLHWGNVHEADLGDGRGKQEEEILARQFYWGPIFGTCWESLAGGHHFRAWQQTGDNASSQAWFVGASKEYDSSKNHMIVPDGWNIGRDWFVSQAIQGSQWKGIWWAADVEWREGLLEPGNKGINHNITQDGKVAILTVNRL
ncbi:hypothetical protein DL96DRAFT_1631113 [Flagelloscypha sp. PMI_526]|nr:hypothetical protein DL96DRAFT_1631113 [Flagelloscypha sp. PMI_526]